MCMVHRAILKLHYITTPMVNPIVYCGSNWKESNILWLLMSMALRDQSECVSVQWFVPIVIRKPKYHCIPACHSIDLDIQIHLGSSGSNYLHCIFTMMPSRAYFSSGGSMSREVGILFLEEVTVELFGWYVCYLIFLWDILHYSTRLDGLNVIFRQTFSRLESLNASILFRCV